MPTKIDKRFCLHSFFARKHTIIDVFSLFLPQISNHKKQKQVRFPNEEQICYKQNNFIITNFKTK